MRVLVCGSRHYKDKYRVYSELYKIADEYKLWAESDKYGNTLPLGLHIISGAAEGVDSHAIDFAVVNWCGLSEYSADWNKYGKKAGPIRNYQMLKEGKPDLVVAFLAPNSRGTKHMIEIAIKAGVPVKIINVGEDPQ